MRVELNRWKFWNPWRLFRPATVLYLGEVIVALTLAVVLLATSNLEFPVAIPPFFCGLLAWTLAEYITHRFVLHSVATIQHGNHHANPQEPIDRIFWQIWLAFAVVYLMTGVFKDAGAPAFKQHQMVETTSAVSIYHAELYVNGVQIYLYDVFANLYVVGGVDQLADFRSNLGG